MKITRMALFGILMFLIGLSVASRGDVSAQGGSVSPRTQVPCTTTPATTEVSIAAATQIGTAFAGLSTHVGTHDDPIPLNETGDVVFKYLDHAEFHITITSVTMGAIAEQTLSGGSTFYHTPVPGSTYMIVYVKGVFIGSDVKTPKSLGLGEFSSVADGQFPSQNISVIAPQPRLDFQGFSGAKFEGNVVLATYLDDPNPLIFVGVGADDGGGGAYFLTH